MSSDVTDDLHRRIGALEAELEAAETAEGEAAAAVSKAEAAELLAARLSDTADLRQALIALHRLGVVPYCLVLDHESAPIPGAALVALQACVERLDG